MAGNASNVSAAKPKTTGAVHRAPVGTALPITATAELATAFVDLGFLSEDGLEQDTSISSEVEREWGGTVVNVVQSDRAADFSFSMMESLNPNVLKTFYGDANVSGTLATSISVAGNNNDLGVYSYVIDMVLKEGALKRIVIPKGIVSNVDTVTYAATESVKYNVTITGTPDSSGNCYYEYMYRGV